MELHGHEPRVLGQLDDLDELAVRAIGRTRACPCSVQRRLIEAVELVAVAVPLVDQLACRRRAAQRAPAQLAR